MKLNFKKLKKDLDNDGDFTLDYDDKIYLIRTGSSGDTDYRISIESSQDENSEYKVFGEFGSEVNDVKDAVECFVENGGSINVFSKYKK